MGAYGLEGLHAPEDFDRLARAAVSASDDMVRAVVASGQTAAWHPRGSGGAGGGGQPSASSVVDALDEISDTVCSVVDVAEVCRNTHPDPRWVAAAERTYVALQGYVQGLNGHAGLYRALVAAQESASGDLTPEAARVALTLRHDFERGGVHLENERGRQLREASGRVITLGMAFQANLSDPSRVGHVDIPRANLGGAPRSLLNRFSTAGAGDGAGQLARVPLDAHTLSAAMRWVPCSTTRQAIYTAAHAGPAANRAALDGMLDARAEVSHLLGFDSHAHYATAPLLAGHPDAVRHLLGDMSARAMDRAGEEMEMMERYQRWERGRGGGSAGGGGVRGWDRAFLIGRARTEECQLDAAAVAAYFPLERVLRGVSSVVSRVLGVVLTEVEMGPGESWCVGVRKLRVSDKDDTDIGTVYLDLSPRPHKFPHAAHFVIRCGRRRGGRDGGRQRPSVALVCNFGGGQAMSAGSSALLSHAEVETFLHELGHAMHSVLSDTEYQHLSGTRCAMDLVEVPSHLFEYFAWDPGALSLISGHRTTGDPMPEAMVRQLRRGKELFGATDLQQQIVFALTDLEVHALPRGERGAQAVSELAAGVQRRHSLMPVEPGTAWELRFGHLVGYASTYYSYVYARCLAAALWGRFFAEDSLAPGAGERLKDGLLRHGGAVDPAEVLRELLGGDALTELPEGRGHAPNPARALAELTAHP